MANKKSSVSGEEKYKILPLDQQIYLRPDTYIGSIVPRRRKEYIFSLEEKKIVKKDITVVDGLCRLFVECTSNAYDCYIRSSSRDKKTTFMTVDIDEKTGKTQISNDGIPIPIKINEDYQKKFGSGSKEKKKDLYNPDVIFGIVLSSSNYDDSKERQTVGRNGYGVKLANIFSNKFIAKVCDGKKTYSREWRKNMQESDPADIKDVDRKEERNVYVTITFYPDFKKFGLEGYTKDYLSFFHKQMVDMRYCIDDKKVVIKFNGEKIAPFQDNVSYAQLYFPTEIKEHHEEETVDSIVTVVGNPLGESHVISFVNGSLTPCEGNYMKSLNIKSWIEEIGRPIVEQIKTDTKKKATIKDIKSNFSFFIKCSLINPTFSGQIKEVLTFPCPTTKFSGLQKIMRWEAAKRIIENLRDKTLTKLTKEIVKIDIPSFLDAPYARTKSKRKDCILFLCEGDSAKETVVAGISRGMYGVKDTKYFGILPLRGKPINVEKSSEEKLITNVVLKYIMKAVGLRLGVDYSEDGEFSKLRYQKLVIVADNDNDGFHICGLNANIFFSKFRSLVERGFVNYLRLPVIVVSRGKKVIKKFYHQNVAEEEIKKLREEKGGITIKYYKGLGTMSSDEAELEFPKKSVKFIIGKEDELYMSNAFAKNSKVRKEWILAYKPNIDYERKVEVAKDEKLDLKTYVSNELILSSMENCERCLPDINDGLKPSQRKILYYILTYGPRANSGKEIKVNSLASGVVEKVGYHHGDSLSDVVVGLATRYPGTNNIPLLKNSGQFGTRIANGGGASPRYIFTKGESYLDSLFPPEDFPYIDNLVIDGETVEKKCYYPVIPLLFANGTSGVATGFSVGIANYNPEDLANWIKLWNKRKGKIKTSEGSFLIPSLVPWTRGYQGTVELNSSDGIVYTGVYDQKNGIVKEIPLGRRCYSFESYQTKVLDSLVEKKKIGHYDVTVKCQNTCWFEIYGADGRGATDLTLDDLGLIDTFTTSNINIWNNGKLKSYKFIDDVLDDWCKNRLEMYRIRIKGMKRDCETQLDKLKNKIRFILDDKTYSKISNKTDEEIDKILGEEKYPLQEETYGYLLNMSIRSRSHKNLSLIRKELEKVEEKLKYYTENDERKIWESEIDAFIEEYRQWCVGQKKVDKILYE
jgi:DNA topoisomerase II